MMSKNLALSVIIDTYNHERLIRAAVDSVLEQSWMAQHSDYEIIVVDDGSVDGTRAILDSYGDRITPLTKVNGGQASAFAAGLARATGEIVMFLDGDDWWHPEKVATVMAEFAANPQCVAIGHGIVIADELHQQNLDQHPAQRTVINLRTDKTIHAFLDMRPFMGTSRFAARRVALDKVGMPNNALTYEADEHFFTLLPAIGDVHVLPQCLTYYRLHGTNLYQASLSLAGQGMSAEKILKRAAIFRCLATDLPGHLIDLGIPADRARAVMEQVDIAATRLELEARGGRRAQTWRIERKSRKYLAFRGNRSAPLINAAVSIAALVLPPQSFYRLRTRYARSAVRNAVHGLSPAATSPDAQPSSLASSPKKEGAQ